LLSDPQLHLDAIGDARRLQLLIDAIVDYAIYMIDVGGTVRTWNSGAERVKGYSANEIIGKPFSSFYTPEDRARGLPQIALKIAAETGRFSSEGWRVRKDRSRFWASVVIDAIRDEQGQLIGFAKVTRDITHHRTSAGPQRTFRERGTISPTDRGRGRLRDLSARARSDRIESDGDSQRLQNLMIFPRESGRV
jgi:PAS domain S-box-containing protein